MAYPAANAPHVPVHLGSMSDRRAHCVATKCRKVRTAMFMMNKFLNGGTHSPDVTVINAGV
jgi:N-methylhydantoinase B/oxoprolinase/acetone carboxylase alpha subunit